MSYDVEIERLPLTAVIELQGEAGAVREWVGEGLPPFPGKPNTASEDNGLELYWVARERWLLRAELGREEELRALTRPAEAPADVSIVQVSDTLQFFAITGVEAGDIVSIGSSIDHHPSMFPENGVSYTDLFGVKGLLVRRPDGFELGIERSFGDMLADCLARANA